MRKNLSSRQIRMERLTTTERSIRAEALNVFGEYVGCRDLGVELQRSSVWDPEAMARADRQGLGEPLLRMESWAGLCDTDRLTKREREGERHGESLLFIPVKALGRD